MRDNNQVSSASKFFVSKPPTTTTSTLASSGESDASAVVDPFSLPPVHAIPAWPHGVLLSMHVYLSTDPYGNVFTTGLKDAELPHFVWQNITFGDRNEARTIQYDVSIPEVSESVCLTIVNILTSHQSVQRNGSLWADIILTMNSAHPDPSHPDYNQTSVHHIRKSK